MGNFNTGFWRSLKQAWRGFLYVWKTEGHLQFHLFAGTVVLGAAWCFKLSRMEWLLLSYAIGAVIATEVINTAIELVVDLIEPNFHPLAGMTKDVAAGAVLVAVIQAVFIGVGIFWTPMRNWIGAWLP